MVLIWIAVCIAAIVIELATTTALVSVWFSVGSIIAALLAFLDASLAVQIGCFLLVSVVSMLIVRPIAARYLRGNIVATNADRCIGECGTIVKAITPQEWGEVKVNGSLWHAVSVDGKEIKEQTKVKIVAIEGAKLLVKKADA